jgi:hypothetical protein
MCVERSTTTCIVHIHLLGEVSSLKECVRCVCTSIPGTTSMWCGVHRHAV